VIISLVFSNKKRKKNHSQIKKNQIMSDRQIIDELCRLENKILDFYDYKKTIEKMKRDEERRKNEDN
jgi:hypothetical protein|tara:strand:- start:553 stop:753 length:201 start_codon:yes stop_codon:yes gene_type:complete